MMTTPTHDGPMITFPDPPTTWPLERTGPDGTTYWIDSAGQVFSPALHFGPCDDPLGVDDQGRWVPRPKPRRGRPRKPRAETAPPPLAPPAPLPPSTVPARVWFVWTYEAGKPVGLGAYSDAEQALTVLTEHPGAQVIEASVS
jgi:hypothetical protein